MPTIQQVIDRVKLQGDITDSVKYRWLGELDKKVYSFPEDKDTELVIKDDTIYDKYLRAMNDFFTGDMRAYEESAREFEKAVMERGWQNG